MCVYSFCQFTLSLASPESADVSRIPGLLMGGKKLPLALTPALEIGDELSAAWVKG